MCGIFGMAGEGFTIRDNDIIRDLGMVSQLRGTDGSGVYQVKSAPSRYVVHNNSFDYSAMYKSCDNFSSYLEDINNQGPRNLMNSTYCDVVMGHVRSATKGVINNDNAHPFAFPNLVGVHNGTLKDFKYMDAKKTDSELMFADMNERGIQPVLEGLDRDSAYTVVVYDKKERAIFFARNELRPLAFAFNEARAVMYWASEMSMLRYVLDRANESYKPYTLRPGVLVRVKATNITMTRIKDDPLRCMDLLGKLDRQLPTAVEKANIARAEWEKKEAEKKAKEQEEAANPKVEEPKDEVKIPEVAKKKSGEIVQFPSKKKSGEFKARSFYSKCVCGCVEMNLIQSSKATRGKHPEVRYDNEQDKFYCKSVGCDPQINIQEKA